MTAKEYMEKYDDGHSDSFIEYRLGNMHFGLYLRYEHRPIFHWNSAYMMIGGPGFDNTDDAIEYLKKEITKHVENITKSELIQVPLSLIE